jgi:protein tyrosine/serine phosphatase
MQNRRPLKATLLTIAVLAAVVLCFAGDRGQPAAHGIENFGKVNDHLYRGAEPDANAIKNLQDLGVKTIIDLRTAHELWKLEPEKAAGAGISYTNVPLNGLGRPTDEQVDHILALIETSPGPVFVHCEYGCDRTGTIIACYRIRHDHWPLSVAVAEAEAYGLSRLERGMRNYIAAFAASDAKKADTPAPVK